MMEEYFKQEAHCKEHDCQVNRKGVRRIYKPEEGLKKEIDGIVINDKRCDCIIECEDGQFVVVEILCGTLTYKEFKDKQSQLENCITMVEGIQKSAGGEVGEIKKVILLYGKVDDKGNSQFKKRLNSPQKLKNRRLNLFQAKNFKGGVC